MGVANPRLERVELNLTRRDARLSGGSCAASGQSNNENRVTMEYLDGNNLNFIRFNAFVLKCRAG